MAFVAFGFDTKELVSHLHHVCWRLGWARISSILVPLLEGASSPRLKHFALCHERGILSTYHAKVRFLIVKIP
eukprot:scaffold25695_cov108-Cylindrotheca_fusiformis.AAC.1